MERRRRLVFLVDVDNTLLDNDAVERDLQRHLKRELGPRMCEHYWTLFERRRKELGYADYLGALQQFRAERLHDPRVLTVSKFLLEYPFRRRLYPGALRVLRALRRRGMLVILSDGDVVFQPHKIEVSGIGKAAGGHALIYIHKEKELRDVARRYPAVHYV